MMDWFETLTGFRERDFPPSVGKIFVQGDRLHSTVNGRSYAVGKLEWPTLRELRERARAVIGPPPRRVSVRLVPGDVRQLHRDKSNAGALFQVASQFNLLEMTGPDITPEHGVTRYECDPTQGPACAIAAGAAAIYRNYFARVNGGIGQTSQSQIDCLADLGAALGDDEFGLWKMSNGYALCTRPGLLHVAELLGKLDAAGRAGLRDRLRIGVHWNVQVTDGMPVSSHRVSQAFCSALPVNYNLDVAPIGDWQPFAELVLEGAYEATLWAAVLNAAQTGNRAAYLTRVGGGVFQNRLEWIDRAMRHALARVAGTGLDVRINCHGEPDNLLLRLEGDFL